VRVLLARRLSDVHRVPDDARAELVGPPEYAPVGPVFRLPDAESRCADSHPDPLSQLNRPTRGTTNYDGEEGLLDPGGERVSFVLIVTESQIKVRLGSRLGSDDFEVL
jgi:hypothetical protein